MITYNLIWAVPMEYFGLIIRSLLMLAHAWTTNKLPKPVKEGLVHLCAVILGHIIPQGVDNLPVLPVRVADLGVSLR